MIIEAIFEQTFGAQPHGAATVPGRVNLIGEHTDYNGGLVLPMPVPRFTHVAIGPAAGQHDEVHSERFGETARLATDQPAHNHWADYAAGALQAARAAGWISGPQRLAIRGDVPDGAGLSSSASLIVAILKAAATTAGTSPTVRDIALMAQAVETDYVGMPCGIMDQMAVAGGEPGKAMRLDTASLAYQHVAIPADWHIAVVHSGVRRGLAEGRYAERRRECEHAARQLNAKFLCQLTDDQKRAAETLDPILARRARHAWSDHERVGLAVSAIGQADLASFGQILLQGHASLRDDFEVSVPEIDRLVETSVQAGAAGARLTGGGFGGCIVAVMQEAVFPAWCDKVIRAHPNAQVIC